MADIAKEYIIACYRNDFNEVDRLYNEHTAICERTVFELHVWCTEAMIAFVGRHSLVPVELRNASLHATEFFSKNKEKLVDYAATFPLNRQKLLGFAVRTDNVEVASSLLADPSFVVKDLDARVAQAIHSGYHGILSLLCEQPQMTPHLVKNIVYAAKQNNAAAMLMLFDKYQGPPIHFDPREFSRLGMDAFRFMDTHMNAFEGKYQAWVNLAITTPSLLRHLVLHKGVLLSGYCWTRVTQEDPELALIAARRGQADWRECYVDDRVRVPMLGEMASLRENGFTTTGFLSFPVKAPSLQQCSVSFSIGLWSVTRATCTQDRLFCPLCIVRVSTATGPTALTASNAGSTSARVFCKLAHTTLLWRRHTCARATEEIWLR